MTKPPSKNSGLIGVARSSGSHAEYSKDFYLTEYECLRNQVDFTLSDYRSLERNVIFAIGVTWAWLFHERQTVPRLAWFIPCLFAALGFFRARGNDRFYGRMRQYLQSIEAAFSRQGDPGGWEHTFGAVARSRYSAAQLWGLLMLLTILVAVYQLTLK